ncbi:hypothetical protein [Deinococcus sp. 6GRE01]|uniref:TubC N-terminal docking domain-related protein n=1 Tax=Deinococcus sp. 6GRE01 TaxID=2745873 RepID=UPI001E53E209|nr:hypothetical protein [Deinococcus sp. 6GRE01]MCD0156907.1 hypothetical protein [Deinococcus sp. 6GRE01]
MVSPDLLQELAARGVRLEVEGGRLIARAPDGAVTPELSAQIRAHKADLIAALQPSRGTLAPLPEALVRLIRAAVGNHLNFPAPLPGGLVSNLGEYVLATAAMYAAGVEPERQVKALWEARGAWAA